MEQSLNHIKHLSLQQPNEKLQKLVQDYQLSNRRHSIHLDNDVTLPFPDDEQKKTHTRQRSMTKKKRASMYQDYTNNLSLDPPVLSTSVSASNSNRRKSSLGSLDQYRHCRPVHTQFRNSLLKSFDIDSDEHDIIDESSKPAVKIPQHKLLSFVGIRNLIFLMLLSTNFRVCLQLINYSSLQVIRLYLNYYFFQNDDLVYLLMCAGITLIALSVAYMIEGLAVSTVSPSSKFHRFINLTRATKKTIKKKKSLTNIQLKPIIDVHTVNKLSTLVFFLHTTNILIFLFITNLIVYNSVYNCLIGSIITLNSLILSFKLASYYLTNKELRELYTKSLNQRTLASSSTFLDDKSENGGNPVLVFLPLFYDSCQYPNNITLTNICQLWLLPTLVYQPVYPMDLERNKNYKYIIYKSMEVLTATILIIYLNNHYALPIFEKLLSLLMFEEKLSSTNRSLQIVEILVKLSITSISIWFLIYYSFFHNFLNILAEFSRFGDKSFYYNWWNSDSILKYWARWNKPLNIFLKRHVLRSKNNSSDTKRTVIIFLICAILAELLIGIPTHNVLGLAFLSVILQLPLIFFTEKLSPGSDNNNKISFTGNCLFWCSFFIGHPLCFLFYYLSWCAKNDYVSDYKFKR